jgi:hypothetical protein
VFKLNYIIKSFLESVMVKLVLRYSEGRYSENKADGRYGARRSFLERLELWI